MAEILLIWRKTLSNQSINQCTRNDCMICAGKFRCTRCKLKLIITSQIFVQYLVDRRMEDLRNETTWPVDINDTFKDGKTMIYVLKLLFAN